jgi:hypothetical protein
MLHSYILAEICRESPARNERNENKNKNKDNVKIKL